HTGETMSKMTKLAFCVTLTMLLVGAYFVVSAAGSHQAGPPRDISGLYLPPPVSEMTSSTFYTTGSPYAVLVAGFNTEDSGVKFTCKSGSGTCSLVVNSFATSSGGGVASDDRALCLIVDGSIAGACGYDASDGSYSAISSINVASVTSGVHTAYMSFYTTYGTTMFTYTNVYSIYKPQALQPNLETERGWLPLLLYFPAMSVCE